MKIVWLFSKPRIYLKGLLALAALYFISHLYARGTNRAMVRELEQSEQSLTARDAPAQQSPPKALTAVSTTGLLLQNTTPGGSNNLPIEKAVLDQVKEVTQCRDRVMVSKIQQRGDYLVLYNYLPAERRFRCEESVTYTTHADYSFLDNLVPLVERWNGPISIALHAPGTDFEATLNSMVYLRECTSPLVREFVTFHVYFSTKHVPKEIPRYDMVAKEKYNCGLPLPYFNISKDQMYRTQKQLLYPINVGRNIARESAQTHYILASDIELYPSPRIIPKFLEMIAENTGPLIQHGPKVYPLHLFEVLGNQQVPINKTVLKRMLSNETALPFHAKVCPDCHNVPKSKEWREANETSGLHVFNVGKRMGTYASWEPIFIGTHADPLYDERLSWEGKKDKMTQGYALCVLNYNFLILDNAFLVHKPGVKVNKKDPKRARVEIKTIELIKNIILPELKVFYGVKEGCAV